MACLVSPAHADVIVVLDEDFETDPPNFQINLQEIGEDATASFEFGDVGTSRGLIFIGTYLLKVDVDIFEYANGILSPVLPTPASYHLYPSQTDGIVSISMSIDAIVEGLPSDNGNSEGVMGIGFQLYQLTDGQLNVYQIAQIIDYTTWHEVGWTNLTAEDFVGQGNSMPDFSPTAGPIAFGFFVGLGYKWLSGPETFISTSTRVDNWKVEADVGVTVFKNGFEQ